MMKHGGGGTKYTCNVTQQLYGWNLEIEENEDGEQPPHTHWQKGQNLGVE